MAIAQRFERHPKLSHVLYPGLASNPGHAVAARQMSGGFGGMMSLRLQGGRRSGEGVHREAARLSSGRLRLARSRAWPSTRERRGAGNAVPADLVRAFHGIEHIDDLIGDIEEAHG